MKKEFKLKSEETFIDIVMKNKKIDESKKDSKSFNIEEPTTATTTISNNLNNVVCETTGDNRIIRERFLKSEPVCVLGLDKNNCDKKKEEKITDESIFDLFTSEDFYDEIDDYNFSQDIKITTQTKSSEKANNVNNNIFQQDEILSKIDNTTTRVNDNKKNNNIFQQDEILSNIDNTTTRVNDNKKNNNIYTSNNIIDKESIVTKPQLNEHKRSVGEQLNDYKKNIIPTINESNKIINIDTKREKIYENTNNLKPRLIENNKIYIDQTQIESEARYKIPAVFDSTGHIQKQSTPKPVSKEKGIQTLRNYQDKKEIYTKNYQNTTENEKRTINSQISDCKIDTDWSEIDDIFTYNEDESFKKCTSINIKKSIPSTNVFKNIKEQDIEPAAFPHFRIRSNISHTQPSKFTSTNQRINLLTNEPLKSKEINLDDTFRYFQSSNDCNPLSKSNKSNEVCVNKVENKKPMTPQSILLKQENSIYIKEIKNTGIKRMNTSREDIIIKERNKINKDIEVKTRIPLTIQENGIVVISERKIPRNQIGNNNVVLEETNKCIKRKEESKSITTIDEVDCDMVTNEDENSEKTDLITTVLNEVFGLSSFRCNQKEIIEASLRKEDIFVLMPTGGGKSITFQLPALIEEGITLVVSPLLSLIQDQIKSLLNKNILALPLSSQITTNERKFIYEIMETNNKICKIFYITPELIVKSNYIQNVLSKIKVSRIVIDEAHCVSHWGHDFRPDYQRIGAVLKDIFKYKKVPTIALTATASPKVQNDIMKTLQMENSRVFKMSFNRRNLIYYVYKKVKNNIDSEIVSFINTYYPDSIGIIYCTSQKECEMISERLNDKYNLKTRFYHAGLGKNERIDVQNRWNDCRFNIIIATIAFGMGIDKKNVRFVIHYSMPKSLEGYYQETGRAGRDGFESICILFYNYGDKKILEFLIEKGRNNTASERAKQKEELQNVIAYCENTEDCRRSVVLKHFGEDFDPENCKGTCDNCMRAKGSGKKTDYTTHAKNIQNFINDNKEMTLLQISDVYKGTNNAKGKLFKNNLYFGKGSTLKKATIETIIKKMINKGYLKEINKKNRMGFINIYLTRGRFINDKIEIIDYKDENENLNIQPQLENSEISVEIVKKRRLHNKNNNIY